MAVSDHVPVPKAADRSVLRKIGKQHQTNCDAYPAPWKCAAHHILPLTCFKSLKCNPQSKSKYILRCLWVSQWNVNGGNKFKEPSTDNNMISLPTFSGYRKTYAGTLAKFKPLHPVNKCSHTGTYGEHYLY